MKLLPVFFMLFLFASCKNKLSGEETQLTSIKLVTDTVMQSVTTVMSLPKGRDSIIMAMKPIALVTVPATSVKVKSYFFQFTPGGNMFLTIESDGIANPYHFKIPPGLVAETIAALQSPYLRVDTSGVQPDAPHFYAYKIQPDTVTQFLKTF